MKMTELYLIRHGETELNAKGVYCGWTDCGLSEKGLAQAEELADILHSVSFDAVIASSLVRASTTAAIVSGFAPEDIIMDDRLRELNFGDWEGLHHSEIKERYGEAWERWSSDWKNAAPPRGESFREMYGRVKNCMEDLLRDFKGKNLLLVSHNGVMRMIPVILLGLPHEAYWSFTAESGRYSHYTIDEHGNCIIRKINCGR